MESRAASARSRSSAASAAVTRTPTVCARRSSSSSRGLAMLSLPAFQGVHRTQIASFSVRPIENLRNFRRIDLVMGQSLTSGPCR